MSEVQLTPLSESVTRRAEMSDRIARYVFLICAVLIVAVIIGLFGFLLLNAFRVFSEGATVQGYFFGTHWDPTGGSSNDGKPTFEAGGLILGSLIVTIWSIIFVTPLAFGMALYFTEAAPRWLVRILQPLIEIFTGMPSVVIGFLGLTILVPFLRNLAAPITGNLATGGFGWAAAILVLIIMVLPTVVSVSIDALRAVPGSVREASLSMGATNWQTMSKAIIPAAAPGLATAIVLGMARAIGETLAVSTVLQGSSLPDKIWSLSAYFRPSINITQQIVLDFGETAGASRDAFWTLAFVLLTISFIFICISRYLASRSVYK